MFLTRNKRSTFMILMVALLVLTGCQKEFSDRPGLTQTPKPTKTATPYVIPSATATRYPTQTPTAEPLGSAANPLVMGFIIPTPDADTQILMSDLGVTLTQLTGQSIFVTMFDDYESLASAAGKKLVHIAWFPPLEYIVANQDFLFGAELVSSHLGVKSYGIQILAHADAPYQIYFDSEKNVSTSDVYTSLSQFSGARPCFTKSDLLAGYIVPIGLLKQASIPLQEPVITFSTSANIRAVYTKGICDFTATYASFGDPRTASSLLEEYPDMLEKVSIIWQSDPIIPNISMAYTPNVSLAIRSTVNEVLIAYAQNPEGQALLSSLNNYEIEGLGTINNSSYDYLRYLLEIQGINAESQMTIELAP